MKNKCIPPKFIIDLDCADPSASFGADLWDYCTRIFSKKMRADSRPATCRMNIFKEFIHETRISEIR